MFKSLSEGDDSIKIYHYLNQVCVSYGMLL